MNRSRTLRILPLAGLVLALGAAGLVLAQSPAGDPSSSAAGRHGRPGMPFERIDADADGRISEAEAEAFFAARRAGLDADGDGFVSFEELQAERSARREERARARFLAHDADGDGKVSLAELPDPGARLFERLDRNHDGVIAREEWPARGAHRRGHDGG